MIRLILRIPPTIKIINIANKPSKLKFCKPPLFLLPNKLTTPIKIEIPTLQLELSEVWEKNF